MILAPLQQGSLTVARKAPTQMFARNAYDRQVEGKLVRALEGASV